MEYAKKIKRINWHTMFEVNQIVSIYNIDPTQTDKNGNTLLHWIAENSQQKFSDVLPDFMIYHYNSTPSKTTLSKFNSNKTVMNLDGLTPYKLWKKKEKELGIPPSDLMKSIFK